VIFEQAQQAGFAEFLACGTACFRDAVGKQNHAVAWRQLRRTQIIIPAVEDAQHRAALPQPFVRAVGAHDEGRVVTGIDVNQPARGAVQMRIEKGDEAVAFRIPVDNGIQPAAKQIWRQGRGRETANSRLQIGHQQRGRHALSSHVGDANSQRFFVERKNVEIVAADQPGRLPRAGDFIARHLRNFARQKFFLDGPGFGDLAFLLLQMKQGLFARPGLLRGEAPRFAALAPQADLFGENLQQPGVGPGLLHKVAHAELHRFDSQAHGGPSGHGYDRRRIRDFLQPTEHVQAFTAGRGVTRIVQIDE